MVYTVCMKSRIVAIIFLVIVIVSILSMVDTIDTSEKVLRPFVTMFIHKTYIDAELAETDLELQLGLASRKSISNDRGMLFLFNTDDLHGIWMKDMEFPVDVLWLSETFKVVSVKESALPDSFPLIFEPDVPARYVVEVNDGFVKKHDIKIGDIFYFSQLSANGAL